MRPDSVGSADVLWRTSLLQGSMYTEIRIENRMVTSYVNMIHVVKPPISDMMSNVS